MQLLWGKPWIYLFSLSFLYSVSLNKHHCPPVYCHHKHFLILRVQFCSIFVQQPVRSPSLVQHGRSPSAQRAGTVSAAVPVRERALYLPRLLLSLVRKSTMQISVSRITYWWQSYPSRSVKPWASPVLLQKNIKYVTMKLCSWSFIVSCITFSSWLQSFCDSSSSSSLKGMIMTQLFSMAVLLKEMPPLSLGNISGRCPAEHLRLLTVTSQLIN